MGLLLALLVGNDWVYSVLDRKLRYPRTTVAIENYLSKGITAFLLFVGN